MVVRAPVWGAAQVCVAPTAAGGGEGGERRCNRDLRRSGGARGETEHRAPMPSDRVTGRNVSVVWWGFARIAACRSSDSSIAAFHVATRSRPSATLVAAWLSMSRCADR